MTLQIETARLRLVACDVGLVQAALADRAALEQMIGARVPDDWPQPDLRDFLPAYSRIVGAEDAAAGWGIWLPVLESEHIVVGDIGFKGGPRDGMVEIGYSVLPAYRRHGYAAEAARALVAWALGQPDVNRVTAECLDDNAASIGVLEKIGMRRIGRTEEGLLWEIVVVE